uniref:Uncharacterized protein n=1 Tax=Arundo donax TaxID=35708 RepID=A0A0A9A4F8_ARUDO
MPIARIRRDPLWVRPGVERSAESSGSRVGSTQEFTQVRATQRCNILRHAVCSLVFGGVVS